jgi:PAS domain S-box-containing protein
MVFRVYGTGAKLLTTNKPQLAFLSSMFDKFSGLFWLSGINFKFINFSFYWTMQGERHLARESEEHRKFGIELVGPISWGTHLCQFYESKQDLIDILVPYFAEGLRSNNFCIWITSQPLEVEEAKNALKVAVPDLDNYIERGQIEVISYENWYLKDGKFESNRVLQGWIEKVQKALENGFEGLRLTGNTFWVERSLWNTFVDYEEAINSAIGEHKMIALCTYCLKSCSGNDVLDVVRNHVGTLIKQGGKWSLVEDSTQRKKADKEVARLATFPALNPNPVIEVDYEGNIKYVNAAAEKALPDLKDKGLLHPFFSEWNTILNKIKTEKSQTVGREQKIGKNWYHQQFYLVQESGSIRVYCMKIDELKETENRLRVSEERWATTVSSIGDAVISTDMDGNITFMNSVAEALTGWNLKDAHQQPIRKVFKIINEFSGQEVESPVDRVITEGLIVGLANHTILVRKDGSKVPIDDSGAPIRDKAGNITGVVLVFRDITTRKCTEEALRKSENRLKLSQEMAHLGSWELDLASNRLTWTDEVYRIFGLQPQEFAATYDAFLEGVHPEDRAAVNDAYMNSLKEGRNGYEIEHRIVRKPSGEIRFVQEKCEHIRDELGKIIRSIGMVQDITERKKAEEELNETRFYLENLLNYANAPIIVWDKNFKITLFNHAFERLTGLKAADVLDKHLEMLFPEDRKDEAMGHIKRTLEGEYWETVEIPILDTSGNVKTVLWNSANIYDQSGKNVVSTIAQGNDITERKQVEQALHRAKVDWERTFDSVPDLIAILDDKHRIIRANKAMAQALGTSPEECVGLTCFRCVHGTERPPTFCPHSKALQDGREHTSEIHEDRLGGDFIVSDTPLIDENGRMIGAVHVARNITQRKEMENKLEEYSKQLEDLVEVRTKQLRDSERLATIGATAGMVGHDIRNPLQAIAGSLYLAKMDVDAFPDCKDKESLQESLFEIERNVEYINKIVADLQDFAKPLKPSLTNTNLKEIIDELANCRNIPENIKLTSRVDPDACYILADCTYIRRILNNLINNAVQAMPSGGELAINAYCEGKYTVIIVEDTGIGIPKEVKGKLFTPLFTTKSKGQGFGLAVVKRMSEALGGSVAFESQEGKGTKFIVRLAKQRMIK